MIYTVKTVPDYSGDQITLGDILEDGKVVEHGPRAALAAAPDSRFATLLRVGMAEVLV